MTTHFGEKLRLVRQTRRFSQTALAQQLGLSSHAVVSNLEAGRKQPSLDLVVMLADILCTTNDYLLRETIPISPPVLLPMKSIAILPLARRPFHERLRDLRQAQGLTQAALASRLGLTTNAHISYLEAGRKEPSLDLIVRLADFFGVTTDDLLRAGPVEEE